MPDVDANSFMDELVSDPEAYRRQRAEAERSIRRILDDPPRQSVVQAEVVLDETLAPAYEVSKAIFESMTGQGEREFVAYLVANAVMSEWSKLVAVRNRVMGMGSVEALAAIDELPLSESARAMAAKETDVVAKGNTPLTDYYRRGYVSTRCPRCRKRAVWHPERHDLLCLDGCGPLGKFEERPGPDAQTQD
jgi:hypothetical protein